MISQYEVLETNDMIEKENLDVRTITIGISLLDCIDSDLENCKKKIFERVAREITFSDMSDSPIETMGVCDEYMTDYFEFNVYGQRIYIKNELLGVAALLLSEQKRNINLMFNMPIT